MKQISSKEFNKHVDRKRKNDILLFLCKMKVGQALELSLADKWFACPVNVYIGNTLRATGKRFLTRTKNDNSGWVIKRVK